MKVTKVNEYVEENNLLLANRIVFVNASGGFGKTTKVKQYIAEYQKKCLWVELDSTCNQKEVFIQRIVEQIEKQRKSLHFCNAGFSVWNEVMDAEMRLSKLFADMHEICDVMVFDNIHVLEQEEVLELLERLVSRNKDISWILIGRRKPDFFIRYVFQEQCAVIQEKDLILGQEAVKREVLEKLSCSRRYAEKVANELNDYVQGWPAGIYVLLHYLKEEHMEYEQIVWEDLIENSNILDYIQVEVLKHLPKEDLEFLKQMSLFVDNSEISSDLFLKQVGGYEKTKKLERTYFFIKRLQDRFTMIPVFCMALRKLVKREEVESTFRMVAEYYVKTHQYVRANAYALGLNDEMCMEQYLKLYGKTLLEEEKQELWTDCILFCLKKRTLLPASILHFMAETFIWVQNQKQECVQAEERKQEQEFYLNLISYNENPLISSVYFLNYYQQLQNKVKANKVKANKVSPKLQITSFGKFCVRIGKEQKELTWRTKKGCELFAYLHHMQGMPVGRNTLLDILWPNGHPKNAIAMLHNMIYNIRKELIPYGFEEIIQYKDKMYSLNMDWIESDLDILNRHTSNQDTQYFKQYPGHYLENIDSHWTMELKEFYDKKYIKTCMSIAERYRKQENFEEAICFLRNVLKVDNLEEQAYEEMIYCYGQRNHRKSVFREYQNIESMLQEELGVEPCQNLKKMYQNVMKRM